MVFTGTGNSGGEGVCCHQLIWSSEDCVHYEAPACGFTGLVAPRVGPLCHAGSILCGVIPLWNLRAQAGVTGDCNYPGFRSHPLLYVDTTGCRRSLLCIPDITLHLWWCHSTTSRTALLSRNCAGTASCPSTQQQSRGMPTAEGQLGCWHSQLPTDLTSRQTPCSVLETECPERRALRSR